MISNLWSKSVRFNQVCLKCGRRCVAVYGKRVFQVEGTGSAKSKEPRWFSGWFGPSSSSWRISRKKAWVTSRIKLPEESFWLQERKDGSVHVHNGVCACICWRVVEDEEMTRHSWEQEYQHFHRGSSCGFNGCRHQRRALWKRTENVFIPGELQKNLIRISKEQVAIGALQTDWV